MKDLFTFWPLIIQANKLINEILFMEHVCLYYQWPSTVTERDWKIARIPRLSKTGKVPR